MPREALGRRFARPGALHACPGRLVSHSEGSHLAIDCEGCSGSSDLSSSRCWAGVLPLIADHGIGEGLLHNREIEVRYSERVGELLGAAAGILLFLRTAQQHEENAAAKKGGWCAQCRSGWAESARHWHTLLLTEPDAFVEELRRTRRSISVRPCPPRSRCGGNLAAELSHLAASRRLLALLEDGTPEELR